MKWAVSISKELKNRAESRKLLWDKKKKEQEREKQKLIKQEGNKYRAQSWLGIWGLAD